MYITAIPNRSSPPAILLRESYREDGKVKTRTLANLSKLPDEAIDLLKRHLAGRGVAVLVIHFGTPSRQNDCARRQPFSRGSPRSGTTATAHCASATVPTSNGLTACRMRLHRRAAQAGLPYRAFPGPGQSAHPQPHLCRAVRLGGLLDGAAIAADFSTKAI